MLMVTPASRLLLFHLYAGCCFLLSYHVPRHVVAAAAASPFSFNFDFSNGSTYRLADLQFEGDAAVHGGLVDLTSNSSVQGQNNGAGVGRMSYNHPVPFYDNTTGQVASFATRFTFAINDNVVNEQAGDGMAFFLSSYPSKLPLNSGGGDLGLHNGAPNADRFVAVEFDTYTNAWDPCANYSHMAIDIDTARNSTNATCFRSFSLNGSMTASITFNNITRMLLASLHFDDHPSRGSYQVSTQLTKPVTALLPSEVAVGFSASTGTTFELHQILSWSFNSTLSPPQVQGKSRSNHFILAAVALSIGTLLVLVVMLVCVRRQRRRIKANKEQHDNAVDGLEYFSLQVLKAATSNFSIQNKLGEGGYGEVFKGELQDGKEIAVKRLSENSAQGFNELKNELVLANRLKHRNLVQLLGVCFQEKLLVYEYMPKGSLHSILFDSEKAHQLDWTKRNAIVSGIARGLLYLHEESPLKIIHRDLKPSNVLLDLDMNPKISDFGLSRAFGGDQSIDITKRPVGTLGYMSPEYAYCGQVSAKSDMYSFGVIVLEIVTGRRNNRSFEDTPSRSLLSYVWEKWSAGSMEEVVDPSLGGRYPESEALSCVQIGLLCVQENPSARPDAPEVVLMLDNHSTSTAIRTPSRPAFCFTQPAGDGVAPVGGNPTTFTHPSTQDAAAPPTPVFSENDVTISDLQPR